MITADEVLNSRFQTTKFREGYDQDEVDDFLDRVVHTLRAREAGTPDPTALTADDIAATRFRATKLREGYDQDDVDALLDRVGSAVADRGEAPEPGLAATAPSLATAGPIRYPETRSTSTPPGMVDVGRGGFRGLFRRR